MLVRIYLNAEAESSNSILRVPSISECRYQCGGAIAGSAAGSRPFGPFGQDLLKVLVVAPQGQESDVEAAAILGRCGPSSQMNCAPTLETDEVLPHG